jgi:hypothetical protein
MRKLRRQVKVPSRIRRHHVLLAAIGVGLIVHEANAALRYFGESKQQLAQQTETRMLDELELWSLRVCPTSAREFHVGDGVDPWGREYRIVCDESAQQMTVAILSLGPDDGETHDAVTAVRTFGP